MNFSNASKLKIKAYSKFEKGSLSGPRETYELQINPNTVNCTFAEKTKEGGEPTGATGDVIAVKRPTYYKETIKFSFTIDATGALPALADGASQNNGLGESIEKLKKATIYPIRSTHAPPYVHLTWGEISLKGLVSDFAITYNLFNSSGKPLRANITIGVTEVVDSEVESSKFQSPDITRIPTIMEGQTLPNLCGEYYDDNRYYLRIAEVNKLPSFRRLQTGQRLLFPPIEK